MAFASRWAPDSTSHGPDAYEQHAHSPNFLVEGAQSRRSAGVNVPFRAVPLGLSPNMHVATALAVPSPLLSEPVAPCDLEFAVATIVEQGSCIRNWRQDQMSRLSALERALVPLESQLSAGRSATSARCAGHFKLANIAAAIDILQWPDTALTEDLAVGTKCPVGQLPSFGIYRHRHVSPSLSCDEMLSANRSLRDSLRSRPPPPADQAAAVWSATLEEQKLGFLSEFLTEHELNQRFGEDQWAILLRFAIYQKDKWRPIDNGADFQNLTYGAEETIHTMSSASGPLLARCLRRRLGKSLSRQWRLLCGSRDMWKAYRQVPIHEDAQRFCIVAVWDPVTGCWRLCVAFVLLFGLSGAVALFNRLPTLLVAFTRRLLAVPAQAFFDDFRILNPAIDCGSGWGAFKFAADFLGFIFDGKKDQTPSPAIHLLGNVEDYSVAGPCNKVLIGCTPSRRELLVAEVSSLLAARHCPPGAASSLRGRMLHVAATRPGRTGRHAWAALDDCACGRIPSGWSSELEFDLLFILRDLNVFAPRAYPLSNAPSPPARGWTDAAFSRTSEGAELLTLCAIIITPDFRDGVIATVPAATIGLFQVRDTQIAMGELLGVLLLVAHFSHLLSPVDTIIFGDNMGVIYNIVNGASRSRDLGTVTHLLHCKLVELSVYPWWEYVESWSNCADGGTRAGLSDPVARSLGITLREVPALTLPASFPWLTPDEADIIWRI